MKRLLLAAVRLYQRTLSLVLPVQCRFFPSCSCYFAEAVERHGALRGSGLGVWRLLRCHPLGGSGYDPVPRARGEEATLHASEPRPASARSEEGRSEEGRSSDARSGESLGGRARSPADPP